MRRFRFSLLYGPLFLLGALFCFPSFVTAAPTPTCSTSVEATYPGLRESGTFSRTQLCQYETACRTQQSDSDPIQGIILPTDPSKVTAGYLFFGGIGGGDPGDHCLGNSKFCSFVEQRQNLAVVIFNKRTTPGGSGTNANWLTKKQDVDCFIDEAMAVASSLGVSVPSYSLMAHSGGGETIKNVLTHKPGLSYRQTLLFDACYLERCQTIVTKPNRGETIIYTSARGRNSTRVHSQETYALKPSNTIGIEGSSSVLPHKTIANLCFLDHLTQAADNQRCGGKATVVYRNGEAIGPSDSTNATSQQSGEIPDPKVFDPQLGVTIPGLTLSSAQEILDNLEDTEQGVYLNIPFLGEYIAAIYRFSVAAGSVIAIVMIMVAGLQWTISRGDSAAIGSAQKRIAGAFMGLFLLLGSYTILYVINPELLNIRSLKVLYVARDIIEPVPGSSSEIRKKQTTSGSSARVSAGSTDNERSDEKACLSNDDCGSNEICVPNIGQCVTSASCDLVAGAAEGNLQLAFIGEGYADEVSFLQEIQPMINSQNPGKHSLLTTPPFSDHVDQIGVWALAVSDTFAGSPDAQRFEALTTRCPEANQFVFISPKSFRSYAYLNGARAFLSMGSDSLNERGGVLVHELGHSFAGLSDEYVEEALERTGRKVPDTPNCATTRAIAEQKWGSIPGTGYFEGCNYLPDQLRPTENSLMRTIDNNVGFGPVNSRAIEQQLTR